MIALESKRARVKEVHFRLIFLKLSLFKKSYSLHATTPISPWRWVWHPSSPLNHAINLTNLPKQPYLHPANHSRPPSNVFLCLKTLAKATLMHCKISIGLVQPLKTTLLSSNLGIRVSPRWIQWKAAGKVARKYKCRSIAREEEGSSLLWNRSERLPLAISLSRISNIGIGRRSMICWGRFKTSRKMRSRTCTGCSRRRLRRWLSLNSKTIVNSYYSLQTRNKLLLCVDDLI